MKLDSYGIASRARGSARGMGERPSMTRVGSIAKRPWQESLAAVGKPYKLPGSITVCGDLLVLNGTLYDLENRSDSTCD